MNYFSMFSGIGGFELGIQRAYDRLCCEKQEEGLQGVQQERNSPSPSSKVRHPQAIGYSEINKYAIATYQKHFGGHKNYGNATKIKPEEIPDFDILVGGFPCQAFSIAGSRKGFDDTRGTLFFDIARILKVKQPKMFLLENVKGLLNHDGGNTFTKILQTIDELGYDAEWQVLNSKHFGVPQNRERVFIIGHLRGESFSQIFPITGNDQESNTKIGKGVKAYDVLNNREVSEMGTLRAGGSNTPSWFVAHNIYGGFKEDKPREFKEYSPTIRTPKGGGHLPSLTNGIKIRRLTPTECERLQGFPDNWTLGSDTQRYKQCGNAVTVNVIEAIVSKMLNTIFRKNEN